MKQKLASKPTKLISKSQSKTAAKSKQYELPILYAFLILSIAGYIMFSNIILGVLAFILLVVTIAAEFKYSVKEEGMKKSIYDIFFAIIVIAALWVILMFVLGTTAPINVVASCSMLPTLHRGDLVFLHGISNMSTFLQSHNIPVVNVSPNEMNYTIANMKKEFLAYFAYNPQNSSAIGEVFSSKQLPIGLYNTKCIDTFESTGLYKDIHLCMVNSQSHNLIKYNYTIEDVSVNGNIQYIPQTSSITIANTTINENYSNPIIVYRTTSNDSFSGDIIHRLVAAIKSGGQYYLLTKGDNNGGLDIQFVNYPIRQSAVVGYVIADVPEVGYLRLIAGGMFATPPGCNSTIIR